MKVRYQFPWPHWSAASSAIILSLAASVSCGIGSNHQAAENQADLNLPLNELSYYQLSEAALGDVGHEVRRFLRVEVPKTVRETRQEMDLLRYAFAPLRQFYDGYETNIEQLRLYFNPANQKYTITYQVIAKRQPNESFAVNGTGHCGLISDDHGHLAWVAEASQSDNLVVHLNNTFVSAPATAGRDLLAPTTTTVCRALNEHLRLRSSLHNA